MSQRISRHFWEHEVSRSQIAARHGIDNTPGPVQLEAAKMLAEMVLDDIRDHFNVPFSPSSWFRCEDVERRLTYENGFESWCRKTGHLYNERSWPIYFALKSHPKGEAADIEVPGVANDDLWEWCLQNIREFDQCIREFPKAGDPRSGWVHVSYRSEGNRHQAFTIP